jgi:DNA-binding IscR family transcriptional regulator
LLAGASRCRIKLASQGIGYQTVRRTMAELRARGLVESRVGQEGTFVARRSNG